MEDVLRWGQAVIMMANVIGLVLFVYKSQRDPDENAKQKLAILENNCLNRTKNYDRTIANIQSDISLIKTNHLSHIEKDISVIKNQLSGISAVLEYKNKQEK